MNRDQGLGCLLLIGSVVGILLYGWLIFLSQWSMIALQATGFIAVAAVLAITAWIGYTLATTPPPQPIEELVEEAREDES